MSAEQICGGCRALERRLAVLEELLLGGAPAPLPPDGSPLARSMADMVTPRQLGNVARLAKRAGVDPDEESRRLYGADSTSLNRNAADALTTHLSQLAAEARRGRGKA